MTSQQQEDTVIEIKGKKYRTERAHVVLVFTKLVDAITGLPLKGVNETERKELERKGYDFIGFPYRGLGYWGKWEV